MTRQLRPCITSTYKIVIPTNLWAQPLTADGFGLTGSKTLLIYGNLPWEHNLVEAPWIIKSRGYYYLFYSAAFYADQTYSVGVARSKSLLGPYIKYPQPILKSNNKFIGPGHCSVVPAKNQADKFIMVYHSWVADSSKTAWNGHGAIRTMLVDEIKWSGDGWPSVAGQTPSIAPQPLPVS